MTKMGLEFHFLPLYNYGRTKKPMCSQNYQSFFNLIAIPPHIISFKQVLLMKGGIFLDPRKECIIELVKKETDMELLKYILKLLLMEEDRQ